MVKRVRASKRQTLKAKYTVQKRVAEHHRKQRKEANKAAREGKIIAKRKNKDAGLPNLLPFKEKFLQEMKEQREREIQLQNKNQFKRRDELMKERIQQAEKRSDDFEKMSEKKDAKSSQITGENATFDDIEIELNGTKKKRQYLKEVTKVIDMSDVILLVLDARDPMAGKAEMVEETVLKSGKKLVLILNKIDLVPKEAVDKWMSYLRQFHPVVAFRAAAQNKRNSHLARAHSDHISLGAGFSESNDGENDDLMDDNAADQTENDTVITSATGKSKSSAGNICVGGDTLLQLLKNYSRKGDMKASITVGVVGYPNVGKSSLINSLKRAKAAGVSSTAGFTKVLQTVQLDKKVKLIDSPGVLFLESESSTASPLSLVLRNCVNVNDISDPVGAVNELYQLLNKEKLENLMVLYRIQRFHSLEELIKAVAEKRGKLKKGGVPDLEAAARIILQDLNAGKIQYFVQPPEIDNDNNNTLEINSMDVE